MGRKKKSKKGNRGSSPPTSRQPPPPPQERRVQEWLEVHPRAKIVGSLFAALSTVLGLFWGFYSFSYDVSISANVTLDPKRAFETRFIVVNQGPFTITDLQYDCEILQVHGPKGYWFAGNRLHGIEVFPELPKSRQYSIRCSYYPWNFGGLSDGPEMDGATLQIWVNFGAPYFPWRLRRGARFRLTRDSTGTAQWLPWGKAENLPLTIPELRLY